MEDPSKDHWQALCEEAANEKDPDKLLELVQKINRLLGDKPDHSADPADRK